MPKMREDDELKTVLAEAMIERGVGSGWIARFLDMPEPEPGSMDRGPWMTVHGALDAMRSIAAKPK